MARVTVEDCVEKVPNRFHLVMAASQRARRIGAGAQPTIERDDDKNPVIALREIAGETVEVEDLQEALTRSHQRIIIHEEETEDDIDLMDGEQEWGDMSTQGQEAVEENTEPSLEDLAGAPIKE